MIVKCFKSPMLLSNIVSITSPRSCKKVCGVRHPRPTFQRCPVAAPMRLFSWTNSDAHYCLIVILSWISGLGSRSQSHKMSELNRVVFYFSQQIFELSCSTGKILYEISRFFVIFVWRSLQDRLGRYMSPVASILRTNCWSTSLLLLLTATVINHW